MSELKTTESPTIALEITLMAQRYRQRLEDAEATIESQAADIENLETGNAILVDMVHKADAEIERLKEDAERASALLNNVYVVNCRIQCDDVEDMNWFDARDRIMNAAKGDKNAAARTHFAAIRRY